MAELDYPKQVFAYYTAKGLPPHQAAALAANSAHEGPGGSTQLGDNGTAFGRFQWRGERQQGLKDYAKANNLDPTADQTQWDYALHEMQTTEKGPGQQFLTSTTPQEANDAMMNFLRPAGQENGPRGVPSYNSRLQMAQQLQGLPQSDIALAMPPSQNIGLGPQGAMQQADAAPPSIEDAAKAAYAALPATSGLLAAKTPDYNRMATQGGMGLMAAGSPQPSWQPQAMGLLAHRPEDVTLPNFRKRQQGLLG